MEIFEEQKKKFFSWIDKIGDTEQIGVMSHAKCADGMTAMIFFLEILKKLKPSIPKPDTCFINYGLGGFDKVINRFKKKSIKKIFLLDFGIDSTALPEFNNFQKIFDLFYIDHHPSSVYPGTGIRDIKTESKDCTSLVLYRFGEGIIDYDKWSWLVCATIVSEFSYYKPENLAFLQQYYPSVTLENISESEPLQNTHKIGALVIYFEDDTDKAYNLILARDFKSIDAINKEFSQEVEKNLKRFENTENYFNKMLFFYELASKFAMGSRLATILSVKYNPSTIILFSEHEDVDFIKISARNNSDPTPYSMNEMLKYAIDGFEHATAGGHAAASGAVILKKDLGEFKKRVIKFVKGKLSA